jgi:hypothetical protein
MAKSGPHKTFSREPSDCDGIVKRDGWSFVSIDAHTWSCPAWKCSKCGATWWSYFDTDNGDQGYDTEEEEEDYE